VTSARQRAVSVALPRVPASADRHPGINGWLSSWGTIGDMAGCPPDGR